MHFQTILAASAAILLSTAAAQAAEVAALSGDNTIVDRRHQPRKP